VGAMDSVHTAPLELYTTKHQVRTTRKTNYKSVPQEKQTTYRLEETTLKCFSAQFLALKQISDLITDGLSIDKEFLNFYITVLSTNLLI